MYLYIIYWFVIYKKYKMLVNINVKLSNCNNYEKKF